MDTTEILKALERGERDRRPVEVAGLRFTSLDRVIWRDHGLTKGDLLRYYVRVAPVILRYIEGRPLMLKRYHEGAAGTSIVQQRASKPVPKGVRTAVVPVAEGEPTERYIGSFPTLLHAVQQGTIEFHVWHSRIRSPNKPDWVVLDLDPSKGAGFSKVIRIAHALRERIEALGLVAGVKTSGSRGLHLYIPTGGKASYDETAELARLLAEAVAAADPSTATVERTIERRGYRVYVDHLQNARGKTAVAPYSVRARPGAPVSMPIRWDEVDEHLEPRGFKMAEVPERLEREGDVWEGLFDKARGDIRKALDELRGEAPRRSA